MVDSQLFIPDPVLSQTRREGISFDTAVGAIEPPSGALPRDHRSLFADMIDDHIVNCANTRVQELELRSTGE